MDTASCVQRAARRQRAAGEGAYSTRQQCRWCVKGCRRGPTTGQVSANFCPCTVQTERLCNCVLVRFPRRGCSLRPSLIGQTSRSHRSCSLFVASFCRPFSFYVAHLRRKIEDISLLYGRTRIKVIIVPEPLLYRVRIEAIDWPCGSICPAPFLVRDDMLLLHSDGYLCTRDNY